MIRQADISDTELSAMDERIGDKISAWPEVQSVSGIIFNALMMPDAGNFFILWGYEPNEYAIRRFKIVEGKRLSSNHQVILGRTMAEALNKDVGDTIELSGSRYRIVGIYETQNGMEEMGGVVTIRDAQVLAGRPHKVSMYAIKLNESSQAERLVDQINQEFPDAYATLSGEFAEQMPDFDTAGALLNSISFLALFIGGVGVLNTMLMSVFERTREIGVLRSLGWRRRSILRLILSEAIWLGLLGGLIGIGIGVGLAFLLTLEPSLGSMLSPLWEWPVVTRVITIAILLGLLGGLYPAYRATRMQPIEALRYE